MILHMRSNWMDRNYNHWVAFLGIDKTKARILDPPHSLATIPFADVMANWDGTAVAVSLAPIDNVLIYSARLYYALKVAVVSLVVYLMRPLLRGKNGQQGDQRQFIRFRRVCSEATVIIVLASVLAVGYHALADTGFLRNPSAVAEVARRYYSVDIPESSLAELQTHIRKRNGVVIDARRAPDFQAGAIPGAISVPVDSTLSQRQEALKRVSRSCPIVVYCQSDGCRYADEVAAFLKLNGYSDVSIYRGGYREWRARAGASHNGKTGRQTGGAKTRET